MARLGENRYGKSRVRLSRITRLADRHVFNEWTVHVMLEGDFDASYHRGRQQQSTSHRHHEEYRVLCCAQSKAETIEEFAMEFGDYLLDNNRAGLDGQHRSGRKVPGSGMIVDGAPEATTFKMGGPGIAIRARGADERRRVGGYLGRGRAHDS